MKQIYNDSPFSSEVMSGKLFSFKVVKEKTHVKSPENETEEGRKPTRETVTFKGEVFMRRLSSFEKVILLPALVLIVVLLIGCMNCLIYQLPFLAFGVLIFAGMLQIKEMFKVAVGTTPTPTYKVEVGTTPTPTYKVEVVTTPTPTPTPTK